MKIISFIFFYVLSSMAIAQEDREIEIIDHDPEKEEKVVFPTDDLKRSKVVKKKSSHSSLQSNLKTATANTETVEDSKQDQELAESTGLAEVTEATEAAALAEGETIEQKKYTQLDFDQAVEVIKNSEVGKFLGLSSEVTTKDLKAGIDQFEKIKKEYIQNYSQNNPFSSMDPNDAKKLILDNVKGSAFEQTLQTNPRILNLASDVMTNEKALPSLFRILDKKDELKTYFYLSLLLFVISFVYVNFFMKHEGSLLKRIARRVGIQLILLFILFSVFYLLFRDELKPILDLTLKNFT